MGAVLAIAALVFHITWADLSDNEEGFNIYRDGALVTTVKAGVQSYDDSAVEYTTQYCYQVSAYNHNSVGDLQEAMSGQACLMVDQPPQFRVPTAPQMGTVTDVTPQPVPPAVTQ